MTRSILSKTVALILASIIGALTVGSLFAPSMRAENPAGNSTQSQPRRRAPELTGGRGWLNTDKPLSLAALKGKIVLLDFWTYGCINCLHIIPDLAKLEKKYANQVVIIGVHSGKYDNEKDTENIRRVIVRYDIAHPVYNDADFAVWRAYNVSAWPTRVLIDPAGYIVGYVPGEGNYEPLDRAIARVASEFRARGELDEQPLKLALERARVGDLPLSFPGKVLAEAKTNRLYIADSSHNRIVVTTLDGAWLDTFGSGQADVLDGPAARAGFSRPQGMALDGDFLYVADTDNHLIRRIDLKARTVETIAGTGRQARSGTTGGSARAADLNSPWDLQLVARTLYIAMAGPHQIWKLDLDQKIISVVAGSGSEGRRDGSLPEARFAQPSGITGDGQTLYAADSEANVIREIDVSKSEVRTVAGANLFEFGDRDGHAEEVRLQHPLGVLAFDNKILIADTYNHKIKELDPRQRTVRTIFGNGKPGQRDGESASCFEPAGLSVANGKLYVADTNNHAIRVIDLKTKITSTLRIEGLQPPAAGGFTSDGKEVEGPNREEINVARQRLRTGENGSLLIEVDLPAGYHLNPTAPQRYDVGFEDGSETLHFNPATLRGSIKELRFPLRIPLRDAIKGTAQLRITVTVIFCRDDNTGMCRIKSLVFRAPIEVTEAPDAPQQIEVRGRIEVR